MTTTQQWQLVPVASVAAAPGPRAEADANLVNRLMLAISEVHSGNADEARRVISVILMELQSGGRT